MSKTVYVYTLSADGNVLERKGEISNVRRDGARRIALLNGNQRVCLSGKQAEIHNNMMWSTSPMKGVYVMKMLEVLLERKHTYEERLASVNRRITTLRRWR